MRSISRDANLADLSYRSSGNTSLPGNTRADPLTTGVELSGAVLGEVGLMAAQVNPDHAVIYLAEAVD